MNGFFNEKSFSAEGKMRVGGLNGQPLEFDSTEFARNLLNSADANEFRNAIDAAEDGGGVSHLSLLDTQGGNATEQYHLTASEHTDVTMAVADGYIQSLNQNLSDTDSPTFNNISVTGLPSAETDAATVGYVNQKINGQSWKQVVAAATTEYVALMDLIPGFLLDDVSLQAGDRVLVKDSGMDNGIYVIQSSGDPIRAEDADTSDKLVSAAVNVKAGTQNGDKAFVCTSDDIVFGSTTIEFVNLGGAQSHDGLSNIQGGQPGEYYHLSLNELSTVQEVEQNGISSLSQSEVDLLKAKLFATHLVSQSSDVYLDGNSSVTQVIDSISNMSVFLPATPVSGTIHKIVKTGSMEIEIKDGAGVNLQTLNEFVVHAECIYTGQDWVVLH